VAGTSTTRAGLVAFLLDTNVFAELARPRPNRKVLAAFERHTGQVVTASIVVHEICFGIERLPSSRRRSDLERFLDEVIVTFRVLPYGDRAARWHATERARLAGGGRTPPFADGQIATIGAVNDATLVTANVDDFTHFERLRVATWWS
jgi:tRNA(fMet)-specific endonuclease VapC